MNRTTIWCEHLEQRSHISGSLASAAADSLENYPVVILPEAPPDVPLGDGAATPAPAVNLTVPDSYVAAGGSFQVSASVIAAGGAAATGRIAFVNLGGIGNWLVNPATGKWQSVSLLATAELDDTGTALATLPTKLPGTVPGMVDYTSPALEPGKYQIAAVYLGTDPIVVAEDRWDRQFLKPELQFTPRSTGTLLWTNNQPYAMYFFGNVSAAATGAQQNGLILAPQPSGHVRQFYYPGLEGPATSLPLIVTGTSDWQGKLTSVSVAPARTLPAEGNLPSGVSEAAEVRVATEVGLKTITPAVSTPRLMQPIIARFTTPEGGYYRADREVPGPAGSHFVTETVLNVEYVNPGGGSYGSISTGGGLPETIRYDGTVTFMEGDVVLGSASMTTFGQAVFTPPALPVGEHVITAHYSGTGFTDCVADPIIYQVRENSVTGTLRVRDIENQTLRLIAITQTQYRDSAAPTGTISFYDGSVEFGTFAIGGRSSRSIALENGEHRLWFRYSGDANYGPFESEVTTYTLGAEEPEPVVEPEPLVVTGTEGDDEVLIGLSSDGVVSVSINGVVTTQNLAQISGIRISAGAGNDVVRLAGNLPAATIAGGDGNDSIAAGPGADLIEGGNGNDTIWAGAGADTVFGGDGDDVIMGGLHRDSIMAGLGNDTGIGGDGPDTIYGGDGADVLRGGRGGDHIEGRGKPDVLYGGAENDTIYGQAGSDEIHGEDGDDLIVAMDGFAFRDRIFAGSGMDRAERDLLDEVRECELLN